MQRIRDLYANGHSYEYIVSAVGCPVSVVTRALQDDDSDADGLDDLSGARCQCGLRMPCNGCLTENRAYTQGPGRALPSSAVIDTNEINEACDRFLERRGIRR